MTTASRIYLIVDTATDKHRLVRAASPAGALRHVTNGRFTVNVASQDDMALVLLSADNSGVESAKAEAGEEPKP